MFVVAHNGARIWGGAERATTLLLAGLQDRGHRVLLLCNSEIVAAGGTGLGVPARRLTLGGDVALPHAARMAIALHALEPDVFIIGTYKKLFLASLAARLARVPRIVARIGLETDTPRNAKYRFALSHWVDAVAVNARRIVAPFAELAGFDPDRVVWIPNGVVSPKRSRTPGALRSELGIPDHAWVVGAIARLARQKRLDRLLRAVAAMPARVHCVLAGDGEERWGLATLASELRISQRVHFLGHRDDIGGVLDALDIFVVSSDREGLSNAMLEAMAFGVPIVSTSVSGAADALEPFLDGRSPGQIVGFSEDAIAAAACSILENPDLARAMGAAARQRVAERFSMEGMLDAWEQFLTAGRR